MENHEVPTANCQKGFFIFISYKVFKYLYKMDINKKYYILITNSQLAKQISKQLIL